MLKLMKKDKIRAAKKIGIMLLSGDDENEVIDNEITEAEHFNNCVSEFMTLVNHPPKEWENEKYQKDDGSPCWDKIINKEIMELREAKETSDECCDEYLHCAVAFFHAYYNHSWDCIQKEK